jgi:hypothetical protein
LATFGRNVMLFFDEQLYFYDSCASIIPDSEGVLVIVGFAVSPRHQLYLLWDPGVDSNVGTEQCGLNLVSNRFPRL